MARSLEGMIVLDDFENFAFKDLDRNALDYYRSGADQERTLKDNIDAFARWRFRPRFLRDVSVRDLSTTVLGHRISFPVAVAPTAMQKLAHPDGELATAKACSAAQTLMGLSTLSTTPLEDVASVDPKSPKWFQLYVYKDRDSTRHLVERAEKAGFTALILTVDTPLLGSRLADVRNKFALPPHIKLANFENLSKFRVQSSGSSSGLEEYTTAMMDPSLSWKDIHWLRSITKMPVVVKGILTAEDAILAVQNGAAGIVVSNHGARQLDDDPATIDVLAEIVEAVKGRVEVYLDGGIRRGTDVLKAIALGAKCVFIGRPALWGLTHSGEQGVRHVLEILRHEFDVAMALSGCASIADVTPSLVTRHCPCRL